MTVEKPWFSSTTRITGPGADEPVPPPVPEPEVPPVVPEPEVDPAPVLEAVPDVVPVPEVVPVLVPVPPPDPPQLRCSAIPNASRKTEQAEKV